MKRIREILALGLALTVMVMGSCSKPAASQGSSGSAESQPITLKFFSNESVMQDAFNLINAEYTRRNPNVTVEVVQVPGGDFNVKVDTTILSGEQLDITYFNNMTLYAPRAMQGEFYALDDLLAEEGIKLLDVYSIDAAVDDGKIYALPGDVKWWVVWLNKDDLDRAGLPVPPLDWNWDDYREYAKKLTWGEGANKHYGSLWNSWDHYNVFDAYNLIDGNPYLKSDGTHNLNHPSFRTSLELRYALEQADKTQLPLSEMLAMQLDYRSVFLSGRASMLIMATNIIPQISQTSDFPHDFVTTFAAMPKPRGGRDGYTYADNRFYSIGATTVNAREAYKYMRYFTTEGIPMKNVTFTAENVAKISMDQMVDNMTAANPKLFDIPQLKIVLNNPDLKPNIWTYVPSYTGEIVNLYWAEADKAVMGEISIDQVFRNAIPQVETIISRNK
jgi:multiple sugar transport system substrate-binding protein